MVVKCVERGPLLDRYMPYAYMTGLLARGGGMVKALGGAGTVFELFAGMLL